METFFPKLIFSR